jgi:hypothetical protein
MKKIILILLLLTSTLCYGQGKYSVRKTYQYEKDDSTSKQLILTENFNANGLLVSSVARERVEDENGAQYVDMEKTQYTYKDTFVTDMLFVNKNGVHKGNTVTYGTYEGGDSTVIHYDYTIDEQGRKIKEIETKYVCERPMVCGFSYNLMDSTERAELREQRIRWTSSLTTVYQYDDCGLSRKMEYLKDSPTPNIVHSYSYDYDLGDHLSHLNCKLSEEHIGTQFTVFRYFEGGYKKCIVRSGYYSDLTIKANNSLEIRSQCISYIYNNKKNISEEQYHATPYSAYYSVKYYYDTFDKLIKKVTMLPEGNRTHLYTYE